jgi:hypothetical protein
MPGLFSLLNQGQSPVLSSMSLAFLDIEHISVGGSSASPVPCVSADSIPACSGESDQWCQVHNVPASPLQLGTKLISGEVL